MSKKIKIFGKRIKVSHIVLFIVMIVSAFIMIAPFLWVFSASLRSYSEATALPPKWLPPALGDWNLKYFKKLFSDSIPFFSFMKNSLKMSTIITIGMVFHGAIAGYAYAKFNFKGKNIMFFLMMVAMMVPVQVTIVALYKIMNILGVINTSWAVTLPSLVGATCPGLAGAFGIFMMRQFFLGVPNELKEAAALDGAGPIRTFVSIMLPMAKSTLTSLAIIVFTFSWNDYFTTFIMINDTEKLSLPVGILSIRQPFATGDNVEFAAVVLSVIPVLLVFIVGQKWIVKSMTHVGVKG
ncbi:carbohydrate ABC transporter permease [Muricomes intestini]|jgi:multiple sugar transport system permease protein|uniref:carbohydrate ABC transporter permease n=1 Tax=Muricomes intestini TaxID=1796634 RepID=UPI002FE189C2